MMLICHLLSIVSFDYSIVGNSYFGRSGLINAYIADKLIRESLLVTTVEIYVLQ